MSRAKWVGLSVAGVALGGMALWALGNVTEVTVLTVPVTAGTITRKVVAAGTVEAVRTVEVGTQISGTVQFLGADFNSVVHAGEIIARLDPAFYETAAEQANAALIEARAALEKARTDLQGLQVVEMQARDELVRATELAASETITDSDLGAARLTMSEATADVSVGQARVEEARAGVAQATAAVVQASINLMHTIIRSPIDGIVIERDVEVGQTLAASLQAPALFRIAADLNHLQIQAAVDEADIGVLKEGQTADFGVESYPGAQFHGRVSQIRPQPVVEQTSGASTGPSSAPPSSSLTGSVVAYSVIVDVANPDEQLRHGMTAAVRFDGERHDGVVRIPNQALAFRPPSDVLTALHEAEPSSAVVSASGAPASGSADRPRVVWKYDGARFTPIPIRVGLSDEHWTELVTGAVKSGDTLATNASIQVASRITLK